MIQAMNDRVVDEEADERDDLDRDAVDEWGKILLLKI